MIILTESYLNEFAAQPQQQQAKVPGTGTILKNTVLHPVKTMKAGIDAAKANHQKFGVIGNMTKFGSESRNIRKQNFSNAYAKHFG